MKDDAEMSKSEANYIPPGTNVVGTMLSLEAA
jgi:hypothetical protein